MILAIDIKEASLNMTLLVCKLHKGPLYHHYILIWPPYPKIAAGYVWSNDVIFPSVAKEAIKATSSLMCT